MSRASDLLDRRPCRREWLVDHPEWLLLPLSAVAWLCVLVPRWTGGMRLCLDPAVGVFGGAGDRLHAAWRTGALGLMLLGWVVMTVAMMLPLVGPMLRQVAARSFAARQWRAVAEFVTGYLTIWTLLGALLVAIVAAGPVDLRDGWFVPASGFLIAAVWQCTAAKHIALLRCHRTMPLSPWGWRADRDCLRFGLAHGKDCAVSCWAMMLACMLASHGLLAMACAQAIVLHERRSRLPAQHRSVLALAGCGLLAVTLGLVGLTLP
jgi:predicted metal-binding membrane protein